jgi:hypothetical protein
MFDPYIGCQPLFQFVYFRTHDILPVRQDALEGLINGRQNSFLLGLEINKIYNILMSSLKLDRYYCLARP